VQQAKRTIKQFYQNFFSGSQCRLYFTNDGSGEHVDGFAFIEYSINSNKSPIFGYSDEYFRAVSKGNYLVQGRMGFNLTSKDRLNKIFNSSLPKNRRKDFTGVSRVVRPSREAQSILNGSPVDNSDAAVLQGVINEYKNYYWGNQDGIKRTRFDQMDLLDNGDIDTLGFNMILLFGYPLGQYSQYYMKQVNSVHILGESMQVTDDGRNTLLVFEYFARAVDDDEKLYSDKSLEEPKLQGAESSKSGNASEESIATKRIYSDDYIKSLHIGHGAGRNFDVEKPAMVTQTKDATKVNTNKDYINQVIGCTRFTTGYTTTFPVKENKIEITLNCPVSNVKIRDAYLTHKYEYISLTNMRLIDKGDKNIIKFDVVIDRNSPYVSESVVENIASNFTVQLMDIIGNIVGITNNIITR
jgi:hypothetical protein